MNVIEKNKTKIFNGLIAVSAVSSLKTSFKGTKVEQISKSAPTKAIIQ